MNQPLLTRTQALDLVLARIAEGDKPSSLPAFSRTMCECGVTPRQLNRLTLLRYLRGEVYPDLKDREGNPIDYSLVPRNGVGRPTGPTAGRSINLRLSELERRMKRVERAAGVPTNDEEGQS